MPREATSQGAASSYPMKKETIATRVRTSSSPTKTEATAFTRTRRASERGYFRTSNRIRRISQASSRFRARLDKSGRQSLRGNLVRPRPHPHKIANTQITHRGITVRYLCISDALWTRTHFSVFNERFPGG